MTGTETIYRGPERRIYPASRRFEGYSYRTSSRFGSHVEISVNGDGWVTVRGRRVSRRARDLWLIAQGGLMGAAVAWLVAGVFGSRRERRHALAWSGALWFLEYLVAAFGALFVWWPADLGPDGVVARMNDTDRETARETVWRSYSSLGFPLTSVLCAKKTRWYWRKGLWLVAWPWQLLQLLAPDRGTEVVFEVDDPADPGHSLVFAVNMRSAEEADELLRLLHGEDL